MDIQMILAILVIGSLASYAISKMNTKMGGYATVLVSLLGLAGLLASKDMIGTSYEFLYLNFKVTTIGWYFSLVMMLTYFSTSFFIPFWTKKIIYPNAYNFFYLFSLAGTIGLFFASDLITLFIFWEIVVWSSTFIVPMGKSRKASVVYYTISAIGSMATFYSIILVYSKFGTFELSSAFAGLATEPALATIVFFLFILSGITKIGIFPFHIWLPLAHGNAPHTFSPVLSGGLVKMGAFIVYLAVSVFPAYTAFASSVSVMGIPIQIYSLMVLGAISMVVGTLMAIKQDDAKKLIAYSSVANGGYILVGVLMADQLSFAGSLMHLLNHAIASAAAFLAIAAVAYRTGTTSMSKLGGMIHKMPITFVTYLIAIISLAGIPPMGGFISKWLIIQGFAKSGLIFIAAAAFFGSIGSFMYVFRPLAAVFLGQLLPEHRDVKEVNAFMLIPMVILSGLSVFFGVFPKFALETIAEIQVAMGQLPVTLDGNVIIATNGYLDAVRIFAIFGFGVVLSAGIFMSLSKSRKVGLMDTYTSAEFIHSPGLYHYSGDFYAPFERLYKNHPSVPDFFDKFVLKIREFGQLVTVAFFSHKPNVTVFWMVAILSLIYLGGVNI